MRVLSDIVKRRSFRANGLAADEAASRFARYSYILIRRRKLSSIKVSEA
jgi:hypothetical protein